MLYSFLKLLATYPFCNASIADVKVISSRMVPFPYRPVPINAWPGFINPGLFYIKNINKSQAYFTWDFLFLGV